MSLNILNHCDYQAGYDSSLLRGEDNPATPRPWDLRKLIQSHGNKNNTLLDIGCGFAFKLIPLAPYFKQIIGVEPGDAMRSLAEQKVADSKMNNITITAGFAENLPLPSHSIDVVSVMLARWDAGEIGRVLKKTGSLSSSMLAARIKNHLNNILAKIFSVGAANFLNMNLKNFWPPASKPFYLILPR